MASVYALPVSSSRQTLSVSNQSTKKRKRATTNGQPPERAGEEPFDDASEPEEYAAVLTPDERSQRRLAGHSLIKDIPGSPFPHKAPQSATSNPATTSGERDAIKINDSEPQSLRLQHISALSSVLHKALLTKDYARARRALGLLLRTDINGKAIDIRAAANWGIGAELLFRQHDHHPSQDDSVKLRHERRKRGFAQAKDLYEMLIVQYPFQRSWPDSVNAVDFYLAMFSLWIYVAQAEARELLYHQSSNGNQMQDALEYREVKMQELQQASEIDAQMDKLMVTAPYSDNTDFLRLQAMVAEWKADLYDECEDDIPIDNSVHPESGAPVSDPSSGVQDPSRSASNSTSQHPSQASNEGRRNGSKDI